MTLLLTEQVDAAEFEGSVRTRMLDFSLPIPDDNGQRVRALKYLNESIDRYISEFCERQDTEDRYLKADLAAEVRAARKVDYQGLSPCLATQVFLCFSICLLI